MIARAFKAATTTIGKLKRYCAEFPRLPEPLPRLHTPYFILETLFRYHNNTERHFTYDSHHLSMANSSSPSRWVSRTFASNPYGVILQVLMISVQSSDMRLYLVISGFCQEIGSWWLWTYFQTVITTTTSNLILSVLIPPGLLPKPCPKPASSTVIFGTLS